MPRKKRANGDQPIGVGLTAKQLKKKKPVSSEYLINIEPLTDNQKRLFESYQNNKQIVSYGAAGTGKTFITLFNALKDVLNENSVYEKIYIVRSLVATREIGFLPGDYEDKSDIYQVPYKHMVKYMFQMPSDADFEMLYGNLKAQDSIMTRVGENSKICFCGDATQTDLQKTNEKNGIVDFIKILRTMPSFDLIEFGIDDIIRSGIVKEYIIAKMQLGF